MSEAITVLTANVWAANLWAANVLSAVCLGAAILVSLALATSALTLFARADPIPAERLFFDDDLEAFGDEPFELRPPARAGKSRRPKPDTVLNVSRS